MLVKIPTLKKTLRGLLCLMPKVFVTRWSLSPPGRLAPFERSALLDALGGLCVAGPPGPSKSCCFPASSLVVFLHPRLPAGSASLGRWLDVAERREKGGEGKGREGEGSRSQITFFAC